MLKTPHDRFDDVPRASGRVGAHRAEQPGINGPIALLWSAAVALVLVVIGIFVSMVLMGRIDLFGAADPEAPQTPGVLAKIDTSYRVLILNATPQTGVVATVRQELIDQGWAASDVFGSDGSTSPFDETTVFYVEKADEAAALGVADVLDGARVEQSDHYASMDATGEPQLTVVIGTDHLGTTSPAPGDGEETPAS
ncbi:LytR C-terminal domain-containing protein [Microbacterium sp. ARD32]|uniref:LytR C-terminal domain-containing protein n=1 Tax=Microbacterium sp. ARD32 TaxID=2962577 RepID=UPI0028810A6F|nr:LytR C-terminal domain-containing protein [Microbacterium sp. ARD32]MDT0158545.1 LytR C-terminal domain-containing protein [Microbacterium sp. ARD32]